MREFMDLRSFLLLKDPYSSICGSELRPAHRNDMLDYRRICKAEDLIERYDIAKASWELYGSDGPPIGVKVKMLFAGHGGGPGVIRRFEGTFQLDPRFFAVSRMRERNHSIPDDDCKDLSLVEKCQWWLHMQVINNE